MNAPTIIASQAERFAQVLADTDPAARVPTCPDWSAADLLWHLTTVHAFWGAILGQDVRDPGEAEAIEAAAPERPDSVAAMLPLRARYTAELVDQLARLDDAQPRWSWWDADQTVGFTRRMQTTEALVHRVDAELTAGLPIGPVDAEVAALVVDHAVDVMRAWMPADASYASAGQAELVASDGEYRRLVEIGSWSGTNPWTGKAANGLALRAPAAPAAGRAPTGSVQAPLLDLALWLWGRPAAVALQGDSGVVAALEALAAEEVA